MNVTMKALLARGISSPVAENLVFQGLTLSLLQQSSTEHLKALGLDEDQVRAIRGGGRPPIPDANLLRVLFESKWCCCVCRDPKRGIVVHHIEPWEESRSHDEENLAVLCPVHHSEAHTEHELTLNLTRARLRELKEEWKAEVQRQDKQVIAGLIGAPNVYWDLINVERLLDVLDVKAIAASESAYYGRTLAEGLISKDGIPLPRKWLPDLENSFYWLAAYEGRTVYRYLKSLLETLMSRVHVVPLNTLWTRSDIASLGPGKLVLVQGAFYFRNEATGCRGPKQIRIGYRQSKGIRVQFTFDGWECCSASSWHTNLSGRHIASALLITRGVSQDRRHLILHSTVIAIGSWIERLPGDCSTDWFRDSNRPKASVTSPVPWVDDEQALDDLDDGETAG